MTEPLSVDQLAGSLRATFENLADHRQGKTRNILYWELPTRYSLV